jgi:plastocyanin
VAAAATLFLVAGCGGTAADKTAAVAPPAGAAPAAAAAAAGTVLAVTGSEFTFSPKALKASAGKTTIRFVNKGIMEHDFTIAALQVHLVAKAGKTAEATVVLKPGAFKSVCTVPGHIQSGMVGTLTVS